MTSPKRHTSVSAPGRQVMSLSLANLLDLPDSLKLPSRHFIALVACDCSHRPVDELSEFARRLLSQGAVVIATWGPDCERFHDVVDETDLEMHPYETDDAVVLTTWHASESLAQALWFVLNTISPTSAYEETCATVLVVSIGRPDWKDEIEQWLAAPGRLADSILGAL